MVFERYTVDRFRRAPGAIVTFDTVTFDTTSLAFALPERFWFALKASETEDADSCVSRARNASFFLFFRLFALRVLGAHSAGSLATSISALRVRSGTAR